MPASYNNIDARGSDSMPTGSDSESEPRHPDLATITRKPTLRSLPSAALRPGRRRTRCGAGRLAWCKLYGRAHERGSDSSRRARIPNPSPVSLASRQSRGSRRCARCNFYACRAILLASTCEVGGPINTLRREANVDARCWQAALFGRHGLRRPGSQPWHCPRGARLAHRSHEPRWC